MPANTNVMAATPTKPPMLRLPSRYSTGIEITAARIGARKFLRNVVNADRRQASSGAAPINSSSASINGPATRLKYGAFNEILSPVTHSEIIGKIVPSRMAKVTTRKSTFCVRKAVSRESTASS